MQAVVYIVDDDDAVRAALSSLIAALEVPVIACAGGAELLAAIEPERAGCIVLDLDLAGADGLELQHALRERGYRQPIIFLSGKGSVQATARAFKRGAFDFLEKPADSAVLLERVQQALRHDERRCTASKRQQLAYAQVALLTARERQVAELTAEGLSNKEIAMRLGISFRTVEIHRARVLHKLGIRSMLALAQVLAQSQGSAPAQGLADP